jgi:hypothetical protein
MLLMQLQYLICEGIDEPWVEAVHRSWYNEDKKLCFWPPKIKDSSKLQVAINRIQIGLVIQQK